MEDVQALRPHDCLGMLLESIITSHLKVISRRRFVPFSWTIKAHPAL